MLPKDAWNYVWRHHRSICHTKLPWPTKFQLTKLTQSWEVTYLHFRRGLHLHIKNEKSWVTWRTNFSTRLLWSPGVEWSPSAAEQLWWRCSWNLPWCEDFQCCHLGSHFLKPPFILDASLVLRWHRFFPGGSFSWDSLFSGAVGKHLCLEAWTYLTGWRIGSKKLFLALVAPCLGGVVFCSCWNATINDISTPQKVSRSKIILTNKFISCLLGNLPLDSHWEDPDQR